MHRVSLLLVACFAWCASLSCSSASSVSSANAGGHPSPPDPIDDLELEGVRLGEVFAARRDRASFDRVGDEIYFRAAGIRFADQRPSDLMVALSRGAGRVVIMALHFDSVASCAAVRKYLEGAWGHPFEVKRDSVLQWETRKTDATWEGGDETCIVLVKDKRWNAPPSE